MAPKNIYSLDLVNIPFTQFPTDHNLLLGLIKALACRIITIATHLLRKSLYRQVLLSYRFQTVAQEFEI